MLDFRTDDVLRLYRALVLVAIAAAVLAPVPADAACDPASCDAFFACGSRECIGSSCVTFPESAGTVCRASAGVCDRAETCNGSSVSCPSDAKRGSTTVCRPAVDECDGAETCDGVSNACTAPDVGVVPLITEVSMLDSEVRSSNGDTDPTRAFTWRISGEQLCDATVDGDPLGGPSLELLPELPGTLMRAGLFDGAAIPYKYPSATYEFSVNRGAVTGSLAYVAVDPDGPVAILSPEFGATLGADPTVTISSQCSSCAIYQLHLLDHGQAVASGLTPLAFDLPAEIPLGSFGEGLVPFPAGPYAFDAEAIGGPIVTETFAGDPSQSEFLYASGRSIRTRLVFNVPEPNQAAAGAAGLVALLGIERVCSARRRQNRETGPSGEVHGARAR